MIDWIAQRHRLFWLLAIYFALHTVARAMISTSLVFDESEQAFLTQWLSLGYNSQPPLYTWAQLGLFKVLGTSVLSMAVLKNACLLATYLFMFGFVYRATEDTRAAIIASIGLVTIPQIGYESHRDLSHTVAVSMATAALFYSTVSVVQSRSLRHYAAIGIAVTIGVMSKYNFAMIVVGLMLAAATLPNYRKRLLDRRILVSVVVAAIVIVPHVVWMLDHPNLVTKKTMTQLTVNQSASWLTNVGRGIGALLSSVLGCTAASAGIFLVCFGKPLVPAFGKSADRQRTGPTVNNPLKQETGLLLERFLLISLALLAALVMTGDAVEFKNRWLQPFIVMLPAYITVRFLCNQPIDTRSANRLCGASCVLMLLFSVALVARPMGAGIRKKYTWLNIPYQRFADVIRQRTGQAPATIIASDMRLAGNLRIHFPDTAFVSQDHPHLQPRSVQLGPVVLVTDSPGCMENLRVPGRISADAKLPVWQKVRLDYLYGRGGDDKEFFFAVVDDGVFDRSSEPAVHVSSARQTAGSGSSR